MDWKKANRIIDDLIMIVVIIILPMFLLDLLGISRLVEMKMKRVV